MTKVMLNFAVLVVLVFLYGVSSAPTPTDTVSSSVNDKPTVAAASTLNESAKVSTHEKADDPKSASNPEEVDKFRTHSPYKILLSNLQLINSGLSHSNVLPPSIPLAPVAPLVPAPAPAPIYSGYSYPSYSGYSSKFLPYYGYGAASYGQSVPLISSPVSHSLPVAPIASAPVSHPVPVQSAHVPVAVSQNAFSKPVVPYNQHVVTQPVYAISQKVIHKPVVTEIDEIIRRPVVSEVAEIIRKPVITELQQVIKNPVYIQHIVKTPSYGSVKQEIYQAPLQLPGGAVQVVDKPVSQVVQLPTQFVQPAAPHVVQTPVVHQGLAPTTPYQAPARPFISSGISYGSYPSSIGYGSGYGFGYGYGLGSSYGLGSGYGLGSSYGIGSGYGLGSSYGSGSGYGLGSGYGFSGSSGASSYGSGVAYQYLTPSPSCRATGNCPRDAESDKESTNNVQPAPLATAYSWPQMMPSGYNPQIPTNIFNGEPMYIGQPTLIGFSDQPNRGRSEPESLAQSQQSERRGTASENDNTKMSPEAVARVIKNDPEAMKEFEKLVEKIRQKHLQPRTDEKFDVDESLKQVKELADKDPAQWAEIYGKNVKPKLQWEKSTTNADQGNKSTSGKTN